MVSAGLNLPSRVITHSQKTGHQDRIVKGAVIAKEEINGGKVMIHCCEGVSWSHAVVIAYLMRRERKGFKGDAEFY